MNLQESIYCSVVETLVISLEEAEAAYEAEYKAGEKIRLATKKISTEKARKEAHWMAAHHKNLHKTFKA